MADPKPKDQDQAPGASTEPTVAFTPDPALEARVAAGSPAGDLMLQARQLEAALARERAMAGAVLPEPRLDEAPPGHYYVVNGRHVDANGNEVK